MNREVKFRAFHKGEKRFIYSDWKYGVVSFWDNIQNDFTHEYEPIQQSIGLKDKNSKEIFEGDIVQLWYPRAAEGFQKGVTCEVVYYVDGFKVSHKVIKKKYLNQEIKETPKKMNYESWANCEVIGNIYNGIEEIKQITETTNKNNP